MTDEMTLHTLDDAIESLDALVIAPTSTDDLMHYVVLSSNQTEPGFNTNEDFTLCGWSWTASERRGEAATCIECVGTLDGIRGLGTRRDV